DLLVLGTFAVSGDKTTQRIRADIQIVDTATGKTLASETETGDKGRILAFVESLGGQLRHDLRESQLSPTEAGAMRHLIPKNSLAAQIYIEGIEKLDHFDPQGAVPLFERAISSEPDYALAHAALASAWSTLGYESRARDEAQKAMAPASAL